MSTLRTDTLQTTDSSFSINIQDLASLGNKFTKNVTNIVGLKAVDKTLASKVSTAGYFAAGDGGGSTYYLDTTDTSSADNGGSIIVATDGGRWKLISSTVLSVKQFGAKMDNATNDSPAVQSAVNYLIAQGGGELRFPEGRCVINVPITIPPSSTTASANITLTGTGRSTIITGGATMTTMLDVTGKNTTIQGILFFGGAGVATNAIKAVTNSLDADYSVCIRNNFFIGIPTPLSLAGQNYDVYENWFQNGTEHILFADDGRNSSVHDNYHLGGNKGLTLRKVTYQAEGMRIFNNTMLLTGGNGYAISVEAGLDIFIGHNVLDQTGVNSVGLYMASGTNSIAKVKVVSNWIAAGQGSYSVFCSGNTSDIEIIANSIMSNNSLDALAGISMNATNGYQIIANSFGIVTGSDTSLVSTLNGTILGNTSNQGSSNAIANVFSQTVRVPELVMSNGPTITAGSGAPSATKPAGSLYLRTDGGLGGHLYVSTGSAWTAVAAV